MSDLRRNAKLWIHEVEQRLRTWDPIGVIADLKADGLPPDEYDSYAPYIVGLLQRNGSLAEIAAHLRYCRTQAMGLPADDAADNSTAREIFQWWQSAQRGAV